MPLADVGQASGFMEMAPGTSFAETERAVTRLEQIMAPLSRTAKGQYGDRGGKHVRELQSLLYRLSDAAGQRRVPDAHVQRQGRRANALSSRSWTPYKRRRCVPYPAYGVCRSRRWAAMSWRRRRARACQHLRPGFKRTRPIGAGNAGQWRSKMPEMAQPATTWTVGLPDYPDQG